MKEPNPKVVGFRGGTVRGEPVPNVVERLEDYLEQAKRGELRAVAVAGVCSDGTTQHAIELPDTLPAGAQVEIRPEAHMLASALLVLMWRYAQGRSP